MADRRGRWPGGHTGPIGRVNDQRSPVKFEVFDDERDEVVQEAIGGHPADPHQLAAHASRSVEHGERSFRPPCL